MNTPAEDRHQFEVVPHLTSELMALMGHRWLVGLTTLAAVLGATAYNYSIRPLYLAVATIEAGQFPGNVDAQRLSLVVNEEIARVTSRDVALKVVAQADSLEQAELATGPIGPWYQRLRVLGERGPRTALPRTADDVAALGSRITVAWKEPSPWLEVSVTGFDPEAAASLANAVIAEYSIQAVAASRVRTQARRDAFSSHIDAKQAELETYVGELRETERQPGFAKLAARKAVLEKQIQGFQDALVAAQTQQVSRPTPGSPSDPRVDEARSRVRDLEDREQELLATLGEKHPNVVTVQANLASARRRLAATIASAEQAANEMAKQAVDSEVRIQARLLAVQKELAAIEESFSAYTPAAKRAEASRAVLADLVRRDEGSIPELLGVKVIQSAVPMSEPWSPRKAENTGRALLGGLLAGIVMAFAKNRLDDTVQFPEQLEAFGLPFLGMVHLVPGLRSRTMESALNDVTTGFGDALRTVRTNLIYGGAQRKARVIVFTSAAPADGKSTMASSIALLLSEARHRVLVIDGDLRCPTMNSLLRVEAHPGLSDLLTRSGPVTLSVTPGPVPGMDVVPAGQPVNASAALLGSDNMRNLIALAKESYDWVIIDSPPSLGLSDASVLATLADGVVIVCSGNKTPRLALQTVARQLRSVEATILGVVLNRIDIKRHSYFYGRYYSPYYGAKPSGKRAFENAPSRRGEAA